MVQGRRKKYELNDTGIEGVLVPEENYVCMGNYDNGVWKPIVYSEPFASDGESVYVVMW